MAVARAANVYICTGTGGVISDQVTICGIKYIGAANGTVTLEAEAGAGSVIWRESGTANVFDEVEIRDNKGVEIIMSNNGEIVYLYSKIS